MMSSTNGRRLCPNHTISGVWCSAILGGNEQGGHSVLIIVLGLEICQVKDPVLNTSIPLLEEYISLHIELFLFYLFQW